ncbi:MAG: hypothetical protein M1835_001907 [Candelina submexicana]|nr:MAG: hypothetical protein M1835_001907 [Candelina submexicana]
MIRWKANERDRTPKRRAEVLERREKKKEARKEAQALKALSAMSLDDEEAVSSFCLHSRTKRRFIEIRKLRSELVGEMKERQRLKEDETGDDSVYDRGEGIDAKQGLLEVVEGLQEVEVDGDWEDGENRLPDEVSQLLAGL